MLLGCEKGVEIFFRRMQACCCIGDDSYVVVLNE